MTTAPQESHSMLFLWLSSINQDFPSPEMFKLMQTPQLTFPSWKFSSCELKTVCLHIATHKEKPIGRHARRVVLWTFEQQQGFLLLASLVSALIDGLTICFLRENIITLNWWLLFRKGLCNSFVYVWILVGLFINIKKMYLNCSWLKWRWVKASISKP